MIHFIKLSEFSSDGKKAFLTLQGQKMGRDTAILPGIAVRPAKGQETAWRKLKESHSLGQVFFTRSLKRANGCYTASDLQPVGDLLDRDTLCFDLDERLLWEKWRIDNMNFPHGYLPDSGRVLAALYELKAFVFSGISIEFYMAAGVIPGVRYKDTDGRECRISSIAFDSQTLPTDPVIPVLISSVSSQGDVRHIREENTGRHYEALCELYRQVVDVLGEIRRTGINIYSDWKIIDGEPYVAETWPFVQDLFDRKGFRRNSELIVEADEYDIYGDSAYWIRYGWLFPGKKKPTKK